MYYYGKNTIKGLVEAKTNLEDVIISERFKDDKFLSFLKRNGIKYRIAKDNLIEELAHKNNHQGVIAKVFEYKYSNIDEIIGAEKDNDNSLVILLDGLEDPQNFGSIIRTSEALQVGGIVIPKNRSVRVNPTVAKVSTGAIDNVKIAQETNLRQVIQKLKDNGYWIVGSDMATEISYDQIDYKMKVALIVGSEGKGISKQVLKECDYIVKLPMYGKISSLNAAVAAAIIMYQINSNRQK